MATNPSYKPNEGKREEFRRYLEKTGVMDALTKVLVLLYEEMDKPDDALLFIQNTLAKQSGNGTIDEMKAQIAELQEKLAQAEEKIRTLSSETPEEVAAATGGGTSTTAADTTEPPEQKESTPAADNPPPPSE